MVDWLAYIQDEFARRRLLDYLPSQCFCFIPAIHKRMAIDSHRNKISPQWTLSSPVAQDIFFSAGSVGRVLVQWESEMKWWKWGERAFEMEEMMKWTHLFCVMFQCMFCGRGNSISRCVVVAYACVCVCIYKVQQRWLEGPLNRADDKVRWLLDEGEPNNVVECSALSKTFHAAVKRPRKNAHTHTHSQALLFGQRVYPER